MAQVLTFPTARRADAVLNSRLAAMALKSAKRQTKTSKRAQARESVRMAAAFRL